MEANQENTLMALRNAFIYKITTSIETSLNINTIHKRLTSLPSDRPADSWGSGVHRCLLVTRMLRLKAHLEEQGL